MEIRVYDTKEQCGKAAAAIIAAQLLRKPASVLGLATGSTPIPCYQELVRLYEEGVLDFSKAVSYNLDEYVGLPADHVCSYHHFMRVNLFDHVNIRLDATHVPSGTAGDIHEEGAAYDAAIAAAGGIDIQVLGIGRNGHIGFNEPADSFTKGCHLVQLTDSTIDANTRFFNSRDEVPKQAITMGIGSIMAAKTVLLMATGADKAWAINATVNGELTPAVPASVLQTHHDVILILDKAAASLL